MLGIMIPNCGSRLTWCTLSSVQIKPPRICGERSQMLPQNAPLNVVSTIFSSAPDPKSVQSCPPRKKTSKGRWRGNPGGRYARRSCGSIAADRRNVAVVDFAEVAFEVPLDLAGQRKVLRHVRPFEVEPKARRPRLDVDLGIFGWAGVEGRVRPGSQPYTGKRKVIAIRGRCCHGQLSP